MKRAELLVGSREGDPVVRRVGPSILWHQDLFSKHQGFFFLIGYPHAGVSIENGGLSLPQNSFGFTLRAEYSELCQPEIFCWPLTATTQTGDVCHDWHRGKSGLWLLEASIWPRCQINPFHYWMVNNKCLKESSQWRGKKNMQAEAGLYEIFIEEQQVASGLINQAKREF